jgi:hypothetical protein
MADEGGRQRKESKMEIKLDDEVAQGIYVNLSMVHHDETEFVIDVMYAQPHRRRATVRARLISSPKHTKRLLIALQEQVRRYEERFGTIELAGSAPADKPVH